MSDNQTPPNNNQDSNNINPPADQTVASSSDSSGSSNQPTSNPKKTNTGSADSTPPSTATNNSTSSSDNNTPDFDKLNKDLEDAKNQISTLTDTAKRAMADLQNYRRRQEEEKKIFIQFANASLLLELLPTLDNLERALKNIPPDLTSSDFVKGIEQTHKGLLSTLEKFGLKVIVALNQPFDAHLHEALLEVPGQKGMIIEEVEKGYYLNDKILRPVKVKVGNSETESVS